MLLTSFLVTNRATTLIDTSASEPPSLKGYLVGYFLLLLGQPF